MKTVTIFIPALNEEKHIGKVIAEIPLQKIKRLGLKPTVLVANGPSKDKTAEIARKKGAVVIDVPRGKGNSVRESFKFIQTDYTIMLDADETYPGVYITPILEELEKGFDIVLGSRLKGKIEQGAMGKLNVIGNHVITQFGNLLFGSNTSDICTGYWGFNKKAIKKMKLEASGFDIEANMFSEANKKELRFSEIPIVYRSRGDESQLNAIKDGAKILWKLFDLRCLYNKQNVKLDSIALASLLILNAVVFFFFFQRGLAINYSLKLFGVEAAPLLFSTIVLISTYLALLYITPGNTLACVFGCIALILSPQFSFSFSTIAFKTFIGFLLFIAALYGLLLTFGKENTQRYIFTLIPYTALFFVNKELFALLVVVFVFYFIMEHKSIASKKLVAFWLLASIAMLALTANLFRLQPSQIDLRNYFSFLHFAIAIVGFNNAAFHKRKHVLVILFTLLIFLTYLSTEFNIGALVSPQLLVMMLIYTVILLTGIGAERIVSYARTFLQQNLNK